MEGFTGGGIHWDTQADVLARARNARQSEQLPDKGVHHDSTNISFLFFQQIAMLQSWWAQSEAKWKKGLTNRFLFSAGRRPIECKTPDGVVEAIKVYLVNMLKVCVRNFGHAHRPRAPLRLPAAAEEAMREARAMRECWRKRSFSATPAFCTGCSKRHDARKDRSMDDT